MLLAGASAAWSGMCGAGSCCNGSSARLLRPCHLCLATLLALRGACGCLARCRAGTPAQLSLHCGRFLVTEGRGRVGGNITSLQGDGYLWEEGPSSFQPNDSMLKAAVCCLSFAYEHRHSLDSVLGTVYCAYRNPCAAPHAQHS